MKKAETKHDTKHSETDLLNMSTFILTMIDDKHSIHTW